MHLEVIDIASAAGGSVNEDRAGAAGSMAWVIDGATDVLAAPIASATSDAAWFAEELHRNLARFAANGAAPLDRLPELAAEAIRPAFERCLKRELNFHHEHPSAAAIVVRLGRDGLETVSLGDCALLVESDGKLVRRSISENGAGDPWVAAAIRKHRAQLPEATQAEARAALWTMLRDARDRMNRPNGYGIFSVIPPPRDFILGESFGVRPGARAMIASDGLCRLTDVFGRYTPEALFEAAFSRGLAALIRELRALEHDDGDCTRHPRAKVSDDATGVLLSVNG